MQRDDSQHRLKKMSEQQSYTASDRPNLSLEPQKADQNLDRVLELFEFFVYSVKESNSYHGTLAFHFREHRDPHDSAFGQENPQQHHPLPPMTLTIRIEGSVARVYNGLPPDDRVTAHICLGLEDFLFIYSGKAKASDVLRLGWQGRISVSERRYIECGRLAQALHLSSQQWQAFEESGSRGTLRSSFLPGKGEVQFATGQVPEPIKQTMIDDGIEQAMCESSTARDERTPPTPSEGGEVLTQLPTIPQPNYTSRTAKFWESQQATTARHSMTGTGQMIESCKPTASQRPGPLSSGARLLVPDPLATRHMAGQGIGRRCSRQSSDPLPTAPSLTHLWQRALGNFNVRLSSLPLRADELFRFEETDASDWWSMNRSSFTPLDMLTSETSWKALRFPGPQCSGSKVRYGTDEDVSRSFKLCNAASLYAHPGALQSACKILNASSEQPRLQTDSASCIRPFNRPFNCCAFTGALGGQGKGRVFFVAPSMSQERTWRRRSLGHKPDSFQPSRAATGCGDLISPKPGNTFMSAGRTAEIPGKAEPSKRVALVTSSELACPHVAWPTVGLFLIGLTIWSLPPYICRDHTSLWTLPISAIGQFILFTPMHDAAHRSVSRYRWLNESIGFICGLWFTAPFRAFRYLHLEHHKNVNHPTKDPDMWSGGTGPAFLRPLFWATQVPYYFAFYLEHFVKRPIFELFETVLIFCLQVVAFVYLLHHGYGRHLSYYWLLPRLFSDTFLAYSFDYAPHRPHDSQREDNIYKSTSVITGIFHPEENIDLRWPLLFQNFHNIHHLYPMIPWYRYAGIWDKHFVQLRELGTPMSNWLGSLTNQ